MNEGKNSSFVIYCDCFFVSIIIKSKNNVIYWHCQFICNFQPKICNFRISDSHQSKYLGIINERCVCQWARRKFVFCVFMAVLLFFHTFRFPWPWKIDVKAKLISNLVHFERPFLCSITQSISKTFLNFLFSLATVQTVFDASPHSKINGTQSVVPTLAVRDAIYGDLNSDLKTDSSTYYNRYRPYYPYYRPSYYPYYNWPYNHYNHPYYHRYPSYNNYYGHYYTGMDGFRSSIR